MSSVLDSLPLALLVGDHTAHHRHTHQTTVHEHRAPTDDSLRLLREMEAEVVKRFLGSYTVPTTVGTVVLHRFRMAGPAGVGYEWHGQFDLNGERLTVTQKILTGHVASKAGERAQLEAEITRMFRAVSEAIAERMLVSGLQAAVQRGEL